MGAKAGVDEELLFAAWFGAFEEEDAGGEVVDVRHAEAGERCIEFRGDDFDVERRVPLLHGDRGGSNQQEQAQRRRKVEDECACACASVFSLQASDFRNLDRPTVIVLQCMTSLDDEEGRLP